MFLSKKQYDLIQEKLKEFQGKDFEKLNHRQQLAIYDIADILGDVMDLHQKQNRKTADYINEKRKTNKNYARGTK